MPTQMTNGGGIVNGKGGGDDGSDLLVPAGLITAREAHGPSVDPKGRYINDVCKIIGICELPNLSLSQSRNLSSFCDLLRTPLLPSQCGRHISMIPKYTAVGEHLRQNVPHEMQCSMFCGGRKCKYEVPDSWRREDMAVQGIFR